MKIEITTEERAFREEVRDWLLDNVPTEPRPMDGPEADEFDRAWQHRQYEGGWAGISWPKEHGGRGLGLTEQMIWLEEYGRAGAPSQGYFFVALAHAGPTLIARGTDAQKTFHLPRILRGESVWCQGFSEPGAGSDLAGLYTRAHIDGDHLVVNGSKIWTSYGHAADYQELLVRTGPPGGRHQGITWVICDMKTPGVEVRPIRNMAGVHELNQTFYDNVRIPLSNVVGELGDGWRVAMATLGFERGTGLIAFQVELAQRLEHLAELARTSGAIRNDLVSNRLATLLAELHAVRSMSLLNISRAEHHGTLGVEGTLAAVYLAELEKRAARFGFELAGVQRLERQPGARDAAFEYFDSFNRTLAGGTSEVRRNIIGERLLGLPRGK
ncbi:acyl-CoA dehydrogenase family protein [Pseudomonas fluorescens]|nr:acyl-CoA dehydrogenase family protein [Pseudomonas fluorescens]